MNQVINAATTLFLPYFTPIILFLLAVVVADRLRDLIYDAFGVSQKRRTEY